MRAVVGICLCSEILVVKVLRFDMSALWNISDDEICRLAVPFRFPSVSPDLQLLQRLSSSFCSNQLWTLSHECHMSSKSSIRAIGRQVFQGTTAGNGGLTPKVNARRKSRRRPQKPGHRNLFAGPAMYMDPWRRQTQDSTQDHVKL